MDTGRATEILQRQIQAIANLPQCHAGTPVYEKWKRDTEIAIEKIFGQHSRNLKDFNKIISAAEEYYSGMTENDFVRNCMEGLATAKAILESMISEITEYGLTSTDSELVKPAPSKGKKSSKRIFVSHSSADRDLAEALVDLIGEALSIPRSEILCTSVDGAKLRGGDNANDVLRAEINQVPAFISILTRKAVSSTYVLFELGARWGCNKHHIPLLAKSAGTEVLKAPLDKHAQKLNVESDVLQLIHDLAHVLNQPEQPANSYIKKAHRVVELAGEAEIIDSQSENTKTSPKVEESPLEPQEIEILKFFASFGGQSVEAGDIARRFKLHRLRAAQVLDRLADRELLYKGWRIGSPPTYRLSSKKGRDYVIANGLLDERQEG